MTSINQHYYYRVAAAGNGAFWNDSIRMIVVIELISITINEQYNATAN